MVERHAVKVNMRTHGELSASELVHRFGTDILRSSAHILIGEPQVEVLVCSRIQVILDAHAQRFRGCRVLLSDASTSVGFESARTDHRGLKKFDVGYRLRIHPRVFARHCDAARVRYARLRKHHTRFANLFSYASQAASKRIIERPGRTVGFLF
jgi:hypothetical protein